MITFANPLALLWLLAVVPAVAAAWYASRLRQRADAAFGGAAELRRERGARRSMQLGLLLAALVLAAVAVARPQWGHEERELTRLGVDVAVAVDISRSMTTDDVQPSRAEAAAAGLSEMLAHLRGDRVGLVTFAGEAFQRSPLTLDLEPLAQLIARSQNEAALVAQGTDLGGALTAALDLLDVDDPADTQVIVLVSDGEDVAEDFEEALLRANDLGVRVYTVAVGTPEGGWMPAARDRPAPDQPSFVDVEVLSSIAAATGGNVRDLDAIAGLAVEFQRLRRSAFDEGANRAPIDRFQWFLACALVLLLAQTWLAEGARGAARLPAGRIALGAAGLLVAVVLAACGSTAYEDVQRGNEAYEDEAFEEALTAYQEAAGEPSESGEAPPPVDYNIGNTLHRLERYEEATVATTAALNATDDPVLVARSTYAAGNHAFLRGDLEAARLAYIAVLLRDPGDIDAKHNLELVLRLLAGGEQPPPAGRQQPPEDEPDPPESENEGEPDEDQDPGDGEGEQGDQEPEEQEPGEGEPGEQGEEESDEGGSEPPPDPGDQQSDRQAGQPPEPQNLDEARSRLSEALLELGDAPLTLDQALDILDLVRITNSLEALEPPDRQAGGALPDR